MNSKKIIIYEYDALFKILSEISDYLNLDIIKVNKDNLNEINKYPISDYLIVVKNKKDDLNNQIIISNTPIRLNKLIQTLNLNFLKNKFIHQSEIKIGFYKLDLNSRKIFRDNVKLNLTEREINLILFLYESKSPVKIDRLQEKVWEYSSKLETHTVETHIYRLRKKIKELFHDDNFIKSCKEGYILK
tara:strand:- start:3911 stop:4474 length:564 start_codon:yes stop_codon:yes gene_type:complete